MEETEDRIRIHAESNGVANTLDLARGGHKILADDVLPVYGVLADLQDSVTEKVQLLSDMTKENKGQAERIHRSNIIHGGLTCEEAQNQLDDARDKIRAIREDRDSLKTELGLAREAVNNEIDRCTERDNQIQKLEKESARRLESFGIVNKKLIDLQAAVMAKALAVTAKDIPENVRNVVAETAENFKTWLTQRGDDHVQS